MFRQKDKNDIAKRILLENGWLREFYHIESVIKSCYIENNDNVKPYNGTKAVLNARKWGFKRLKWKYENIFIRYPKYRENIRNIYYKYMDDLRDTFENTWNNIIEGIRDEQKTTE